MLITPEHLPPVVRRLVDWHAQHGRDLPWRDAPPGARDAYAVLVSEIMLQQTRVEVVTGYFLRWMERFPSVQALAAADLQDVLRVWEGLGYYARARNLHRAAQAIVALHGEEIPADRAALLALSGIGEYTAGAILSLAFNQPEPVLDGNVKRVLSRLGDVDRPIDDPATLRELWNAARAYVAAAPGEAGAANEALMELGARICTPAAPRCMLCPVAGWCLAAARGTQAQRPVKSPPRAVPHYDVTAGVIWRGEPCASQVLIAQRPHKGMLGGLWEFPGGKMEPGDANLAACLRREIAEELGIEIEVGAQFATVRHAYTHFRITLHAFHARHTGGAPQALGCDDWRWVELGDLAAFPFPVTDRKIVAGLERECAG